MNGASMEADNTADTPSTFLLLQMWRRFAHRQADLHDMSSSHFQVINYMMMIPAVMLSSAAGVGAFTVSTSDTCSSNAGWVPIVIGTASLLSSALVTIHKLTDVAVVQKEHDLFSDMYINFANEIDMQLALHQAPNATPYFANVEEFMKHTKHVLDNLVDKAPIIPHRFIARANRRRSQGPVVPRSMQSVLVPHHAVIQMPLEQ